MNNEMDDNSELNQMRRRTHDLADVVHAHGIKIELHTMAIANLKECIDTIRQTSATSEQMRAVVELVTAKLDHLTEKFDSVNQMVTWAIRIVIGAVILGVLAMVIKS